MIIQNNNKFLLQTENTSYMFQVLPSGHLEHIHYGASIIGTKVYRSLIENTENNTDVLMDNLAGALSVKHAFQGGNMIAYSKDTGNLCLENTCLEMSSLGKGDIRDPFVEIVHTSDGADTSDFLFEKAVVRDELMAIKTLPCSVDDEVSSANGDKAQQLEITLKDSEYDIRLVLTYTVYPECDVITRRSTVIYGDPDKTYEQKEAPIIIKRLLSTQIDFHDIGYRFTSFHGKWADEMHRHDSICTAGKVVSEEIAAGESGSRSNPFVMVSDQSTTDEYGNCYAFNLVYSGNHYEALSANGDTMSRFVSGIQPVGFSYELQQGECFEAPEAVMSFSSKGMNDLSHHMHDFVRKHITRGTWRDKERPILINSWEASYFNFTQASLVKLASAAAKCGIELFVMDDGWFGARNDDKRSLGDWTVNTKKLPDGIKGLADKINALGMSFGLWVEPEMVNEDSDLYRAHPDWAVKIPGHKHSEGRTQLNLDLTRSDVQDYIIDSMRKVFSVGNISYIKWDMNRIFSDRYSQGLSAEHQGEFMHRYYIGLYRIMDTLTREFPDILFEGCSAGGNRFDLGILCYFPQIWGSDDTDAMVRTDIQDGYSYGYPQVTVGSHVSAVPNHQTLDITPLETRFEVAARGCLGYELNLNELSDSEIKNISEQVQFYKKWRKALQFGDYYRLGTDRCMIVSKEKDMAAAFVLERKSRPNHDFLQIRTQGLDEDMLYHMTNRVVPLNVKDFGSLINTMAPVHVKQDGILHNIVNKFVQMSGESEDLTASGAAFNGCGVRLKNGYAGTGYDGNTRIMRPGDSRMYLFEKVNN